MPVLTDVSQTLARLESCVPLIYLFLESDYYNLAIPLKFLAFPGRNASGIHLNDLLKENK